MQLRTSKLENNFVSPVLSEKTHKSCGYLAVSHPYIVNIHKFGKLNAIIHTVYSVKVSEFVYVYNVRVGYSEIAGVAVKAMCISYSILTFGRVFG